MRVYERRRRVLRPHGKLFDYHVQHLLWGSSRSVSLRTSGRRDQQMRLQLHENKQVA